MDPRLVHVSRLFYEQNLSKTEIAEKLNISITHVNRLLKEAARRGVVKITIQAPRYEDLELGLREKFGLLDTRVISPGSDEQSLRSELAIAAANYFEEKVVDKSRIGLGSGRTLFEMVSMIEEKPRHLTLFPICIVAEQDLKVNGINSNIVVNSLWFKCRPTTTAYRLEMFFPGDPVSEIERKVQDLLMKEPMTTLVHEVGDLDYYFFSCSHVRPDSQIIVLAKNYGMEARELQELGIIGDFLFNTIDANGKHISTQIEKILFRIDLDTLKRAAQNERKKVVLIAGGTAKVTTIQAGLNAGLFNVLITDSVTANSLIQKGGG